jgi:hypothetical protein
MDRFLWYMGHFLLLVCGIEYKQPEYMFFIGTKCHLKKL